MDVTSELLNLKSQVGEVISSGLENIRRNGGSVKEAERIAVDFLKNIGSLSDLTGSEIAAEGPRDVTLCVQGCVTVNVSSQEELDQAIERFGRTAQGAGVADFEVTDGASFNG